MYSFWCLIYYAVQCYYRCNNLLVVPAHLILRIVSLNLEPQQHQRKSLQYVVAIVAKNYGHFTLDNILRLSAPRKPFQSKLFIPLHAKRVLFFMTSIKVLWLPERR